MRAAFLAGSPVTVSLVFAQEGIDPSKITQLEYEVASPSQVLVSRTPLTLEPGATFAAVQIDAQFNALAAGTQRDLRLVHFYAITDAGTSLHTLDYAIEGANLLQRGLNSFQSYEEALLLSYELSDVDHWLTAPKSSRINTLAEAYRDIAGLRFCYAPTDQSFFSEAVAVSDITLFTDDEWKALPKDFKQALCRAQIMQANHSFAVREHEEKINAGVQSITVGESKTDFSSRRPASVGGAITSPRVRKELAKWLYISNRIGRA